MEYILGLLILAIVGGVLIWLKTKRTKYVVIYSLVILLLLLLPWVLLLLAFATGADFKD